MPERLKFAFVSAQKLNLKAKQAEAKKSIIQHTSGSALVGFTPIPFSDAPVLLANQAGMIIRILFIYDLKFLLANFSNISKSLGVPALLASTGIWISGQLLKFLPGVGTIIGGMINASVAASLTGAIGFAISEICYRLYILVLEGNEANIKTFLDQLEELFGRLVKEYFKQQTKNKE
ncbi:GTP-binding protein [Beggiatoa sp. PS]|nr:GTP-binding protein [Beggiatoa sp. PS]